MNSNLLLYSVDWTGIYFVFAHYMVEFCQLMAVREPAAHYYTLNTGSWNVQKLSFNNFATVQLYSMGLNTELTPYAPSLPCNAAM